LVAGLETGNKHALLVAALIVAALFALSFAPRAGQEVATIGSSGILVRP